MGLLRRMYIRLKISIHALREEGDTPANRAEIGIPNFYPRPPRGGRPWAAFLTATSSTTFLSTPSARRATEPPYIGIGAVKFLSTPSARRATSTQNFTNFAHVFLSTPSARRATTENVPSVS